LEQLGLNLGLLIVQVLAFTIVLITLIAWVYKPFTQLLTQRRQKIAQGLEDARVAGEARAQAESQAQHVLDLAQQEASRKLREAAAGADTAGQTARAAAEKEIAALRASARAEAEAERDRILADVRGEVAALALAAAQKILGEALDEKRQRALIDEFFSGVRSGKVVLLDEAGTLPAAPAEVVSALPLSEKEQAAIRADLRQKIGAQAEVAFRVDPAILGGLKIRVGDRVIDGTMAGRLAGLRQSMR
jgi:F-type H+-transporting ATPase subunit b